MSSIPESSTVERSSFRPTSSTTLSKALAGVSVHAIFPCLVFGTTLVQQEGGFLPFIGQAILWIGLVAAVIIVLLMERATLVCFFIIAAIIAFRIVRITSGEATEAILGYQLSHGLLFGMAGASVLIRCPDVLYRQMMIFVVLSGPVMLLQLYGEPAWAQALRKDMHGTATEDMVPVLFLTDHNGYPTIQARPAGFMFSNNFLSIIIMYILAVHFSLWKEYRLRWTDVALALIVVLAMAKIVFLTIIIFTIYYALIGPRAKRRRLARFWIVMAFMMGTYYSLFPGVFKYNLSYTNFELNFLIRLADLKASIDGESFAEAAVMNPEGELIHLTVDSGSQSGYSIGVRNMSIIASVSFVVALFYFIRLRALRRTQPVLSELSRNGLMALLLMPLITSFISGPFFAFASGTVFIPFLVRRVRFQSAIRTPSHHN